MSDVAATGLGAPELGGHRRPGRDKSLQDAVGGIGGVGRRRLDEVVCYTAGNGGADAAELTNNRKGTGARHLSNP